ncbi:MAG: glutaredoxin family protein [Halobacteriales archaeon]
MELNEYQESIEGAETEDEMRGEIQRAIDEVDVLLFMKGNEMMPQCGYSARALKAVGLYADDVVTVDVLRDRRIREVLEDVTDWPTIPQVFVDGEFLGGSDVVVEMHEEGELERKIEAV